MFFPLHFLKSELSKNSQSLLGTKQLHALIIKTHLADDPFYSTRIVRFYAINGNLCSARKLFDRTPSQSVYLWNSIIRAYANAQEFGNALSMFFSMLKTEIKPDNFTYSCIIRACSENFDRERLKFVHGQVVTSGLALDYICSSALVTAYSKLGLVDMASKVFDEIPQPDLVLWNSIISGFGYCGFWYKGLELFSTMRNFGNRPDGYTIVGVVSCIADSSLLSIGKGMHGFCLKSNFDSNGHVASVLVSMYSRCKCMNSAYLMFSLLSQPDLVTWSALITGYSQSGDCDKALLCFKKLNLEGKKADPILITGVLAASAQSANLRPGIEIHGYVLRHGLESNIMVCSSLIDMYSKCGFVALGIRVFGIMPKKNIVSYNAIILGLGLNGLVRQALEMLEDILRKGLLPDKSTFSALLCACCHAGLVEDGRVIFRRMQNEFCNEVGVEHFVYMVKLLGMAGELKEAYDLIRSLPEPVDSGIWGALLSCCDAWGNAELAEIVAQNLFENNPEKSAYRVMLSNVYAGEGRWDDVKKLRDMIPDSDQGKVPGLSWIASKSCKRGKRTCKSSLFQG